MAPHLEDPEAQVLDAAGCLVFPGFIDAHTHLDMECAAGFTADDFETGTRAALAGGTTTVVDFATQDKGQTLEQGFRAWEQKARGKALCDYGFHMAITDWTQDIPEQMADMCRRGITSFKLYLAYDNLRLKTEQVEQVLSAAARLGAVVCAHCEDGDQVDAGIARQKELGHLGPQAHPPAGPMRWRPGRWSSFWPWPAAPGPRPMWSTCPPGRAEAIRSARPGRPGGLGRDLPPVPGPHR